jgi:16S rRNA processing protein RimM
MAVVGRIAKAHGIRGLMLVHLDTDFPEDRFRVGAEFFIRRGSDVQRVELTSVRFHQGRPLVGIDGVATMNDAGAMAGLELRVPPEQLKELPAGTFYHHDLVGCQVDTAAGEPVGVVKAVDATFGGSRLVVDRDGAEVQIPLVDEICRAIDVAGKRIVIAPPEGLLDLNS